MIVGGIDPGLRETAVALVDVRTCEVLVTWLTRNPEKERAGVEAWEAMAHALAGRLAAELGARALPAPSLLVIEDQWISPPRRAKPGEDAKRTFNPSQIVNLAHVVGAIMVTLPAARKLKVMPSTWKGGSTRGRANKAAVNKLTWATMTPGEKLNADGAETYLGHNVKDSIGIAKWAARNFARLVAEIDGHG